MEEHIQEMMRLIGEKIRKARLKAELTQEQLAEEINVSRISIARYETGEMLPKLQNLAAISLLLNVSVDYLLGLDQRSGARNKLLSFEAESALEKFVQEIIEQYEKEQKLKKKKHK